MREDEVIEQHLGILNALAVIPLKYHPTSTLILILIKESNTIMQPYYEIHFWLCPQLAGYSSARFHS